MSRAVSAFLVAAALAALAALADAAPSEWAPTSRVFGAQAASRRSFSAAVQNRVVTAAPAAANEAAAEDGPEARASTNEVGEDDGWFSWLLPSAEMRLVGKVWEDCAARDDATVCLKGKALTFLDRAARKDSLALPGGLSLVRTAKDARADSAPVTETELEATLPRDLSARDSKLDAMLLDRVLGFVQSHAVRFNLADQGEERGIKKKDLLPYLFLGKLVAGSMVAMAFTALALLAGKALMVSKIALLLSGVVALKKLFNGQGHGGGGGGGGAVDIVNVPGHARALGGSETDAADAADAMAYRGQIQRPATAARRS